MLGEGLAASTLSSIAIPLGLSAGLGLTATFAVALIWLVTSLLGTAVVRLTVARTKAKSDEELAGPPFDTIITRQPRGVAALIVPWNWPLSTPSGVYVWIRQASVAVT